jgi:hypothetical protein
MTVLMAAMPELKITPSRGSVNGCIEPSGFPVYTGAAVDALGIFFHDQILS